MTQLVWLIIALAIVSWALSFLVCITLVIAYFRKEKKDAQEK